MMQRKSLMRCAAWLLALCAVMPMAMSCSNETEKNPAETTAAPKQSETIDEKDPYADRKKIPDDLGEYDFEEYEYRIVTSDGESNMYFQEDVGSDVVEAAVYERNRAVEERFNCKIKVVYDANYMETGSYINMMITTDENAFDIISSHVVSLGGLVPSMLFYNWYDVPNINFDKPWWSDSTKDLLTHYDVCYLAIGDLALSAMNRAYAVFYNKRIAGNYDFPNLYDVVNEGKWTLDKMVELSKDLYEDLNMNGAVDVDDDLFGFLSSNGSPLNTFLWAFDNPIYTNVDGDLQLTYHTEKLSSIFSKLCDTFHTYRGIQLTRAENVWAPAAFTSGRMAFVTTEICNALKMYRNMEDEYGIIPYPKWDEAQKEYITMSDGSHHAMAIPKNIVELEKVGTITEALCAESYKNLFPVYYDTALKVKGARDEESIAMLDMIVESRMFDFGYVFDNFRGFSFLMHQQIDRNNKNIESVYERYERSSTRWYDSVLAAFENYGDY